MTPLPRWKAPPARSAPAPEALPSWKAQRVCRALAGGGVIAYPTEGVWGLGCDPDNAAAVGQILALKRRDWRLGLILIAARLEWLQPYLDGLPPQLAARLQDWPPATTYLVPDNGRAPEWITGGRPTLALRLTRHPLAAALSTLFGGPLVSTSANPAGRPAARSALRVRQYFGQRLDLLVPGALGANAGASEIRDLASGKIVRPAGIRQSP